jgi:ATP adenylyltransferase
VRTGSPETGRGGMILLNAYPYVGGHLLVALGDGRPKLADYTPEQQQELWSLVTLAAELCEDVLNPQGLNIGMNVGRAAGAGVPEHLHAHVIPRWFGDVNFITTAGNVRLINASLDRFYEQYTACWDRVRETAGPDVGDG